MSVLLSVIGPGDQAGLSNEDRGRLSHHEFGSAQAPCTFLDADCAMQTARCTPAAGVNSSLRPSRLCLTTDDAGRISRDAAGGEQVRRPFEGPTAPKMWTKEALIRDPQGVELMLSHNYQISEFGFSLTAKGRAILFVQFAEKHP